MTQFEEVYKAYLEEGSRLGAAWKLHLSLWKVSEILKRGGILLKTGKPAPVIDYDKIVADYLLHQNQYKVAKIHQIPQPRVSRILRSKFGIGRGATLRCPKQPLPIKEIAARYLAGDSCQTIARDYPVCWSTIHKALVANGIRIRTPKENARYGAANRNWKGGGQYPGNRARTLVEEHVGRTLLPGTIVHHQNEDPFDNSLTNLWIFPNGSCHALHHHKLLDHLRQGLKADANHTALENGGAPLLKLPDQSTSEHSIGLLALFYKEVTP